MANFLSKEEIARINDKPPGPARGGRPPAAFGRPAAPHLSFSRADHGKERALWIVGLHDPGAAGPEQLLEGVHGVDAVHHQPDRRRDPA